MPKTLADGRIKLSVLTTKPANPAAPKVAELTAGIDISCQVLKSDYRLGATSSETVNEPALCSVGNATAFGASNYEGNLSVFLLKDSTGKTEETESTAWEALKAKGTTLWLVEREGPLQAEAYAAGQIVDVYEVLTDTAQKPQDRTGYIKRTIPLGVQNAWEGVTVAAP